MLLRRCWCSRHCRRLDIVMFGVIICIYVICINVTFDIFELKKKAPSSFKRRYENGGFSNDTRLHVNDDRAVNKSSHLLSLSTAPNGRDETRVNTLAREDSHSQGDTTKVVESKGDDSSADLFAADDSPGDTPLWNSLGAITSNNGANPTMDFTKPETVLLAGKLRSHRMEFSLGMVTVQREKGDYFFSTVASLLSESTEDRGAMTIVVMLADRNDLYNEEVLKKLQDLYSRELKEGVLLVIHRPDTEFIFKDDLKRTYNDTLMRVRWRSKQNLDYAALMEFCTGLSVYYLHLEDDVLAAKNYLSSTRAFIAANANQLWAMLEVCPHGFIGKLFHNKDLPKLVTILRAFYLEQPCDFLIKPFFINMMTQTKPIVRKGALFFHQGKFSSLKNVTRKVDKVPGSALVKPMTSRELEKISKNLHNKHYNPPATVLTDMSFYNYHIIQNAYSPSIPDVFWASDVKKGQSVSVLFLDDIVLSRVIVETGYSDKTENDSLKDGMVMAGSSRNSSSPDKCVGDRPLGTFKSGRFDVIVTSPDRVTCLSIVINQDQKEWLVIRSILVYVKT